MSRHLVLASASLYRKQLLQRLAIPFVTQSQDVDETPLENELAKTLTQRLAKAKAQSCVSRVNEPSMVIASDQVGQIDTRILGKPGNYNAACEQLRLCSGNTVMFYTAVEVVDSETKRKIAFVDETAVKFQELSDQRIEHYVSKEQPYESCGSFQAEGMGICLVDSIVSTDPTAIIGLPLIRLAKCLEKFGITAIA